MGALAKQPGGRREHLIGGPGSASVKHRSAASTRRQGQDPSTTAPPWPDSGVRPAACARRRRARPAHFPAPKRVPAREHHSAAGGTEQSDCRRTRKTRSNQAQLDAGAAKRRNRAITMPRTRAAVALLCVAATTAFLAPQRSVARPSSSHAQPTTPAAMRQQTQQAVHESRRRGTSRLTHELHAVDATTTKQSGARLTRQRPHRQLNMVIPGDSAARVWVEINQLGYLARNIC